MAKTFTNKFNLPESYVRAVKTDKHRTWGDISVTQLTDAPQVRVLRKTHDETIDVSTMVAALFGTAIHSVLEQSEQESVDIRILMQAAEILIDSSDENSSKVAEWLKKFIKAEFPDGINENVILEQTMTVEYLGWILSGTLDRFTIDSGLLEDYKSCGVYQFINPESRKKWFAQQNIYAHMLRKAGYTVNKAQIVAIFKDWSKGKVATSKDYPPQQIMCIDIPLFPDEKIEKYIIDRIKLHQDAEKGNVPDCTGKERWAKADSYAVFKEGGKRALRVVDKESAAKEFMRANEFKHKQKLYIEYRPGTDTRCDSYCSVSQHCPQLKRKMDMIAAKELELNK